MSNLNLGPNPSLRDFQDYITRMVQERGFQEETLSETFMLLLEECGEMAKAARKLQNMKVDETSEKFHIAHEAADVFMYLLNICNRCGVDLEQAFRDKEEINKKRTWK